MNIKWIYKWWAMRPSLWENNDEMDRPTENVAIRNILRQSLAAQLIRDKKEVREKELYERSQQNL